MENSSPPICQKCHRRRLHPVKDRGHRWCKECREAANARLHDSKATADDMPTADEKRLMRTVYGKYTKYDFEAMRKFLIELQHLEVIVSQLKTRKHYALAHRTRRGKRFVHLP